MKKSSLILAIIFLISMCSFQRIEAQDKSKDKEEKEKQMLLQESIEAQKKAMVEQKKAQEDALKILEEQKFDIEKAMENVPIGSEEREKFDQAMKIFEDSRGMRSLRSSGEPFLFTPGVEFYGQHFSGDNERTTWEFSKYMKESSLSRSYTIDVEPTVNNVVMAVIGDCKEGEIRIKILMPNNKVYSDVLIDESGNLNWRKSFTISETENKDKAGAWKFEIDASKASGYFKISLQSY
jgi:hypothetical protein